MAGRGGGGGGGGGRRRRWDARDWDEEGYRRSVLTERELVSRTVFRTAFAPSQNPSPKTLVVASSDGSLASYSISSCISSSHSQPMHFNWKIDQQHLYGSSFVDPLCIIQGHKGPAYDLKFFGDGEESLLLSCGDDGRIRGWRWIEVLSSDVPLSVQGNHLKPVLDLVNPQHDMGTYNIYDWDYRRDYFPSFELRYQLIAVVSSLGDNNVMVILDNHISKPGWCCSNSDGNGFFGDTYFDPDVWIQGLTKIATMFNGTSNVVGMSLRNELRGPKQNVDDWYRYMQKGAEAVHAANPDVLVILSGMSFDNDLSFLARKPVNVSFSSKLVFELHWYSFSDSEAWRSGNANDVCGRITGNVKRKAGFLLDQGFPLLLSEFGVDNRGGNANDNRYFGCAVGVLADWDLDWALWTLQGSYYLRQGVLGLDEVYGVLGWDWCKDRNSSMLNRIQALQPPFQGPGVSNLPPYTIIFHPSTGLCVLKKYSLMESLELGPCNNTEAWTYTSQHTLMLKETLLCLRAEGSGKPAKLGTVCTDSSSKWQLISDSKMHISSNVPSNGAGSLCLDVGNDGRSIVTNLCKCLTRQQDCDPESQWFRLVISTRSIVRRNPLRQLPHQFGRWKIM